MKNDEGTIIERAIDFGLSQSRSEFALPKVGWVRCSSLYWSTRRLYYQSIRTDEDIQVNTSMSDRRLTVGTRIHESRQEALDICNSFSGIPEFELEELEKRASSEEWMLSGTVDALMKINGKEYVWEFKTINSNQFSRLLAPLPDHHWQGGGYMILFDRPVLFTYENKDTHEMKHYVLNDFSWRDKVKDKLITLKKYLELGTAPTDCEGNCSSWCQYKKICKQELIAIERGTAEDHS